MGYFGFIGVIRGNVHSPYIQAWCNRGANARGKPWRMYRDRRKARTWWVGVKVMIRVDESLDRMRQRIAEHGWGGGEGSMAARNLC